jgi:sarcosine oxidase, subunit alpha
MRGNSFRLAAGGRIDRSEPIGFAFNGRQYLGCRGDTLASALIANGVHLVARSFKYHRPRGVLTAGCEEPNALVQWERGPYTTPNVRATQLELYDGLDAASVNAWPSVDYDVGAANALFSRMLVAGFYYKTFMRPAHLWERLYEPAIRRMAGIGRSPTLPDPDRYDRTFAHCDVLVVGAGPAGLAAALAAGRTSARVMLVDEQNEPGGSLLSSRESIGGVSGAEWVEQTVAEIACQPESTLLRRTVAFGYYDHNYTMLLERRTDHLGPGRSGNASRERLWHIRAKTVVLATGAHERPLVFADNDRPGTLLAGAAETYVNRYAALPGRQAVVFTNNDLAYRAALSLADAGAEIAAVVDVREHTNGTWPARLRERGTRVLRSHGVIGTRGKQRVTSAGVAALDADGYAHGTVEWIACDILAISGGWNPAAHLFSQSQGKLRFDETIAAFVPAASVQRQNVVGSANGTYSLGASLAEGSRAGAAAAVEAGFGDGAAPLVPRVEEIEETPLRPFWLMRSRTGLRGGGHRHFIDYQTDVTAADVRVAVREGLSSIEHVKRYTTAGMGTDQGKTGNVGTLALVSEQVGRALAETGTTTFRPPYTPVTFGALAGRERGELIEPVRTTPIHSSHMRAGAVLEDVGQWKRARYYPRAGEDMKAAVRRECLAVRNAAGVLDASTLGKIDVQGPDAGVFLDRIYVNDCSTLTVGKCRYGLMLRDDGMLFDDGVIARLSPERFLLTTTTGNAARVLDWLEEWLQTEWPDLKVYCTSVTEQWTSLALAGPRSGAILSRLAPDLPLEDDRFPHMSVRQAAVAGVDARILRVSFTGELSFEINVPARWGLGLWDTLIEAGRTYGLTPYGTEAMHVLRAEKGFIIVGQETDGSVTPIDLGLSRMMSKKKDFIGKRSLRRSAMTRPDRRQLVGLFPRERERVLAEGTQLVSQPGPRADVSAGGHSIGYVTSSYFSSTLGRSFALALVEGGRQRIGSTVFALVSSATMPVAVTEPVFLKPRLRVNEAGMG